MYESHAFDARLECRYLLQVPPQGANLAVIALHGYGMSAESMLRLTAPALDGKAIIASLQAPNQHYQGEGPKSGIAAYNWGIRQHHADAVRLHHEMVHQVVAAIGARFGIPPRRCVLLGFSQPVGLNYRFVATHPHAVGGVIGICGGVPKDWEDADTPYAASFDTPLLHIARDQDEFFPTATVEAFPSRLRHRASRVDFHLLPGQHRFPSAARHILRPWLDAISITTP